MIKTISTDGKGRGYKAEVSSENALLVAQHVSPPLVPQKSKIFVQQMYIGGNTSYTYDMRVNPAATATDGACADHSGPPFTFTSVTGGLLNQEYITITDAGAGGHGIPGKYKVVVWTSTNSVGLETDPTDGTNETGLDWVGNNAQFSVNASSTADRYITTLSFLICDASATLNEFGHVAALTNGCRLFYEKVNERVYIHEAAKSNWDIVRLCLGSPPFGTGTAAFQATNVVGASEAYIPVLNLGQLMPPYGIKLDMGSSERLVFEIRDDTSGLDALNIMTFGFDRFE